LSPGGRKKTHHFCPGKEEIGTVNRTRRKKKKKISGQMKDQNDKTSKKMVPRNLFAKKEKKKKTPSSKGKGGKISALDGIEKRVVTNEERRGLRWIGHRPTDSWGRGGTPSDEIIKKSYPGERK